MAIFHLTAKVISRGKGQSAIAAAAYRSGQRLVDEATGAVKHYRARAARIVFAGIFAPKTAPAWARDRQALWNNVERAERRVDATLAREIELALPHELTDAQRLWLVKDFAREAFIRRGLVVDVAIHAPDKAGDRRNVHAHFLIVERPVGPDGFARCKDRGLQSRQTLYGWRRDWAALCNRHLARHGHLSRIDHRSLKAQKIDREPTKHIGVVGTQMERRGVISERGAAVRCIRRRNLVRDFEATQPGAAPTPRRAVEPAQSPLSAVAFRHTAAALSSPVQILSGRQPESVASLAHIAHHEVETAGEGMVEASKCAVIRCKQREGSEPSQEPDLAGDDGGGIGAECAAIHAAYGARIDALRRSLPPDQARAAVQAALAEQHTAIHDVRQRHMREAASRRDQMRRWRRRQRALLDTRTA